MDAPDKTQIEREIRASLEAMSFIAAHCELGQILALVTWTTTYMRSLVRWGVLTQEEADRLVFSFGTDNEGAPTGHIINGL